jgi:hypothetical protein
MICAVRAWMVAPMLRADDDYSLGAALNASTMSDILSYVEYLV